MIVLKENLISVGKLSTGYDTNTIKETTFKTPTENLMELACRQYFIKEFLEYGIDMSQVCVNFKCGKITQKTVSGEPKDFLLICCLLCFGKPYRFNYSPMGSFEPFCLILKKDLFSCLN